MAPLDRDPNPQNWRVDIDPERIDLYLSLLDEPRALTATEATQMVDLVNAWRAAEHEKHIALMAAVAELGRLAAPQLPYRRWEAAIPRGQACAVAIQRVFLDFLSNDQAFALFERPSGVIYEHQYGGTLCRRAEVEGDLVPVDAGVALPVLRRIFAEQLNG